MNKFKKGDIVVIYPHRKNAKTIRARVLSAIAHTQNGTIYQVISDRFKNLILRVNENNIILVPDYDGNTLSSWEALKHIWIPKNVNTPK